MIKRRFFKLDKGGKDEDSDSSDSDSDSDSQSAAAEEGENEEDRSSNDEEEEGDDGGDEWKRTRSSLLSSGYESEDSSGKEIKCDSSGLLLNDDEDYTETGRQDVKNRKLFPEGKFEGPKKKKKKDVADRNDSNVANRDNVGKEKEGLQIHRSDCKGNLEGIKTRKPTCITESDPVEAEACQYVLACKSVFKCRICPRIVCLSDESITAHLKSKRHSRSKKLLAQGRLKLMLNSDGEIEEEAETHSERHERTIALSQKISTSKGNKGRQRQKMRQAKKIKRSMDRKASKSDPSSTMPAKKKRRTKD